MSYLNFKTFRKHRGYMGQYIANTEYPNIVDSIDMDIYYGKENEILKDSLAFYKRTIASGIFYDRSLLSIDSSDINPLAKSQLEKIKQILDRNKTNFQIIISPMYDQVSLKKGYLNLLIDIYGKEFVHDFSGVNDFTSSLGNFYEKSHYSPHVAREIMRMVYSL